MEGWDLGKVNRRGGWLNNLKRRVLGRRMFSSRLGSLDA